MLKGITLVAVGHPFYGKWAYNLAVSIKAVEDFPIALLYTDKALSHLSAEQLNIFDKFVSLPTDTPAATSAKLLAGELSPWEETLILDVDMVWMPEHKPSDLFELLKGVTFTAISEGNEAEPAKNYFFWASVDEIRSVYTLKVPLTQWRTEVVYFNKEGSKVFTRALEIVKNPGLTTILQHATTTPDELGVNIAAAEMGITPHQFKWQPSYWPAMHNNFIPAFADLYRDYYLLSMGSNFVSDAVKKIYNSLMGAYCNKLGVQHLFEMVPKRNFLPQRKIN